MNTEQNNPIGPPPEPVKKGISWLIAIIVILTLFLGTLIYLHFDQKSKMKEMETILTAEKDSLTNELSSLMYQYDTLKTNNDSINKEISVQQDKIEYLLKIRTSNAQKIRLYKKELGTLREVMKSYIRQIDSLNTKNLALTAENKQVRSQINDVKKSNEELNKIKKDLTSKVETASVLQAKNILAISINDRGKEKNKISKIDKIQVCFTLRENPISEPGNKEVFMRIIRPDKVVLTTSVDNLFDYQDEKLVFSASRTVEYLNKDVDLCIYWNNSGNLIPGNYTVNLYLEGNQIGTTTFLLK